MSDDPNDGQIGDPIDDVIAQVRAVYARWGKETTVAQMRRDWDDLFRARAVGPPPDHVEIAGVRAAWVSAADAEADATVLYLHGGGFRLGSVVSHLDLMQRLSVAANARVLGLDYRLAPEHLFPAPLEDVLAVYGALARAHPSSRIAFAGDSAGGGLCLSTMLAARAAGLPPPCGALLMSAWTDLEAAGASYETHARLDPIHKRPMILAIAKGYLGALGDPRDPHASPLHGDLRGLPPLLVQCGERETVLDDSRNLVVAARAAGVPVELEVYEGMIHVFQMFAAELSSARRAIASGGAFLRRVLAAG